MSMAPRSAAKRIIPPFARSTAKKGWEDYKFSADWKAFLRMNPDAKFILLSKEQVSEFRKQGFYGQIAQAIVGDLNTGNAVPASHAATSPQTVEALNDDSAERANDGDRTLRGQDPLGHLLPLAGSAGERALPNAWRRKGGRALRRASAMRSSTDCARARRSPSGGSSIRCCARCVRN